MRRCNWFEISAALALLAVVLGCDATPLRSLVDEATLYASTANDHRNRHGLSGDVNLIGLGLTKYIGSQNDADAAMLSLSRTMPLALTRIETSATEASEEQGEKADAQTAKLVAAVTEGLEGVVREVHALKEETIRGAQIAPAPGGPGWVPGLPEKNDVVSLALVGAISALAGRKSGKKG